MMTPGKGQDLDAAIDATIRRALAEDIGDGDVTTLCTIAPDAGRLLVKAAGVIAGLEVARAVFARVERTRLLARYVDGDSVDARTIIGDVAGPGRAILSGERVALNFLQRMSGVATATRQFVDTVRGTRAVILDTRKTAPGLRALDKWAVRVGGGRNHRMGLYDMVLIDAGGGNLRHRIERHAAGGFERDTADHAHRRRGLDPGSGGPSPRRRCSTPTDRGRGHNTLRPGNDLEAPRRRRLVWRARRCWRGWSGATARPAPSSGLARGDSSCLIDHRRALTRFTSAFAKLVVPEDDGVALAREPLDLVHELSLAVQLRLRLRAAQSSTSSRIDTSAGHDVAAEEERHRA
jgi:hypothetical protein